MAKKKKIKFYLVCYWHNFLERPISTIIEAKSKKDAYEQASDMHGFNSVLHVEELD